MNDELKQQMKVALAEAMEHGKDLKLVGEQWIKTEEPREHSVGVNSINFIVPSNRGDYFVTGYQYSAGMEEAIMRWQAINTAHQLDAFDTSPFNVLTVGVDISNPPAKRKRSMPLTTYEVHEFPPLKNGDFVFAFQRFIEGKEHLKMLQERLDKKAFEDADHEENVQIVQAFQKIYNAPFPSTIPLRLQKDMFVRCLNDIWARFQIYLPRGMDFVFTNDERWELVNIIDQLIETFKTQVENSFDDDTEKHARWLTWFQTVFRWIHGDPWARNTLWTPLGIQLIDFGRVVAGPVGYDTGRYWGDFEEFFQITGNQYFRDLGEDFVKQMENIHPTVRLDACLGLAAKLPIKLHPAKTLMKSDDVRQRFKKRCMDILRERALI